MAELANPVGESRAGARVVGVAVDHDDGAVRRDPLEVEMRCAARCLRGIEAAGREEELRIRGGDVGPGRRMRRAAGLGEEGLSARGVDHPGQPVAGHERRVDPLGDDLRPGGSVFAHASEPDRIGRDLHSIASELGVSTARLATQVLRHDPEALFVFRRGRNAAWLRNAKQTVGNPATIVASDGIYRPGLMHPRGYGTFPRFLRLAVRKWGVLDLPTAIHMMTGRTAARYRLPNRGVLAVGGAAEVVAFDLETVAERCTFAAPRRFAVGIRHVVVNGTSVVDEGLATYRPGRTLPGAR